eukprot:3690315-Heterocapsa_arctica.AAC.1
MVTCPDRGLSITFHNLRYTHERYCKGLKEKEQEVAQHPTPPPPPGLFIRETTTTADVEDVNEYIKTNPE